MVDRGEAEQHCAVVGGQAFHLLELLLCSGEADRSSHPGARLMVCGGFNVLRGLSDAWLARQRSMQVDRFSEACRFGDLVLSLKVQLGPRLSQ